MRCQHIERLIIDASDRILTEREQRSLENHAATCGSCRRFAENYSSLKDSLAPLSRLRIPEELDTGVLLACRRELRSLSTAVPRRGRPGSLPKLIWPAIGLLTGLTAITILPAVEEIQSTAPLSLTSLTMLTIILQNASMLIFSPILLRKFRKRHTQKACFKTEPKPA